MNWFAPSFPIIPADVPRPAHKEFQKNLDLITKGTYNRLLLFSADQKIEHLNQDFYGSHITPEDNDPAHLFNIAQHGSIGAMATHLGLLCRYGLQYKTIPFLVKLNGKTNIVPIQQADPLSTLLTQVQQVVSIKKEKKLAICGIGYTIYLGSQYEHTMLYQAAQAIYYAHQHGLVTTLWLYPRGKAVDDPQEGNLIAGAAGVACALGSDFVKLHPPHASTDKSSNQWLSIAAQAAGNTKIICSGGKTIETESLLQTIYDQLHYGNSSGNAIGRNIHQRSLTNAITLTNILSDIIYNNKTITEAKNNHR